MDNKRRQLFVIKQSKGCICVPKMHQIGGRAPPAAAGKAYAVPQIAQWGPTSKGTEWREHIFKGREGERGEGPYLQVEGGQGRGRTGGEREQKWKGTEFPQVNVQTCIRPS